MDLQNSPNCNNDSGIFEAGSPVSLDASYTSDSFDNSFSDDSEVDASASFQSSQSSTNEVKMNETESGPQRAKNKTKTKKIYTCQYCQKVFNRPSALQTHTYTHTAEKPFQCLSPNCGRYFSVVSNLRRHFKVHQKAQNGNKLSSEDRLRCVKQLMQRSRALMIQQSMENITNDYAPPHDGQPKQVLNQKHPNRKHHYPILPAIHRYNGFSPYSNLPSPPLSFTPTFENQPAPGGGVVQNCLFDNSLFPLPQLWPIQFDDPDFQDRQSDNDSNSIQANPYLTSAQMSQNDTPFLVDSDCFSLQSRR